MTFLQLYTIFHTALSIVAITAGILVVKGLINSDGRQMWTLLFLVTATATTITGFFFPFNGFTPAFVLGMITVPVLVLAILGRYRYRRAGTWRGTYVITTVLTLYFNCFVLIVQSFQKVPSLNVLAPTQTEPPFKIAQLLNLVLFIAVGIFSFRNYRMKTRDVLKDVSYISPRLDPE